MALLSLFFTCLFQPAQGFAGRFPIIVARPSLARVTVLTTSGTGALYMSSSSKNTFNPFRMVGDMASNLLGANGVEEKAALDQAVQNLVQDMTWERIRQQLEQQMQTDDERNFRANLAKGYGMGSPLHKVRLFDESNKEEDIRVTFYRDSARSVLYHV